VAVFHRFAHDKENLPEMPEILLVVRVEREMYGGDGGAPGFPGWRHSRKRRGRSTGLAARQTKFLACDHGHPVEIVDSDQNG
jgi:hypothetical protein